MILQKSNYGNSIITMIIDYYFYYSLYKVYNIISYRYIKNSV